MKNELYEEMYEYYKKGYSLQEVGKTYNRSRQCIYDGFKNRDYKLRNKKLLPSLTFNNITFGHNFLQRLQWTVFHCDQDIMKGPGWHL